MPKLTDAHRLAWQSMDNGTEWNELVVSHETTNTLTEVWLVSGTNAAPCTEDRAITAAEAVTGLTASHADPTPEYDGWTVTLHRRY